MDSTRRVFFYFTENCVTKKEAVKGIGLIDGESFFPRVSYFTTRVRLIRKTKTPQNKTQQKIDHQRRLKRNLLSQNIEFIAARLRKVRVGLPRNKRLYQGAMPQEMGVDVRTTLELGKAGNDPRYGNVSLPNSDRYLVPAMSRSENRMPRFVCIAMSSKVNIALVSRADSLLTYSSDQIIDYYKKVQKI